MWRVIILCLLIAVPELARAETPASKQDVEELKEEVRELRSILIRLLEVEEARARGLAEVLAETKSPGSTGGAKKTAVAEPRAQESKRESGTGTITGRVRVTGSSGTPVAYVYVDDVPGRLAKNKTVQVRQVEKRFVPSVLVVQRGTKVLFPNEDNIFHNVFSLTPGASFDLGTYRAGDPAAAYTFMQSGVVDVFCNLHSNMNASVLVVPNTYYAKVDAEGRFTIAGVPAGKRKIVAWTPNVPPVSKTVEVQTNSSAQFDVEIQGRDGAPAHTNKNGVPYGSYQ
jgi:plastocyanin